MRTKIVPVTLDQQLRVFLEPESYWRRVQIILPDSPVFYVTTEGRPETFGLNRPYKAAPLSSGAQIEFPLAPGQHLAGQVQDGMGVLTLIEAPCDAPKG